MFATEHKQDGWRRLVAIRKTKTRNKKTSVCIRSVPPFINQSWSRVALAAAVVSCEKNRVSDTRDPPSPHPLPSPHRHATSTSLYIKSVGQHKNTNRYFIPPRKYSNGCKMYIPTMIRARADKLNFFKSRIDFKNRILFFS